MFVCACAPPPHADVGMLQGINLEFSQSNAQTLLGNLPISFVRAGKSRSYSTTTVLAPGAGPGLLHLHHKAVL